MVAEGGAACSRADDYVERRAGAVRTAIAKHGGPGGKRAELPTVLIENSSRAPTNAAGEKLLGNKRPWLPDLMRQVRLGFPQCSECRAGPAEHAANAADLCVAWMCSSG